MDITTKQLAGLHLLLALCSTNALADRPAMSERNEMPAAEEQAPASESDTAITMQQTSGDVLEIQPGETIPVTLLDFPRRGMSMDKVENELGRPIEISDTVGDPPITSWTYADRVVYFEYSTVLHVVARR
jgi:hypothetical protein